MWPDDQQSGDGLDEVNQLRGGSKGPPELFLRSACRASTFHNDAVNRLIRAFQLVGLNSVPVVGVLAVGWSDGTALALYWCESVLGALLVALRIRLHRKATNKRGHYVETKTTTTS